MDKVTLEAQVRDSNVKAKDLLTTGVVPAIFYGKGVKNQDLQVNYQAFRKAYKVAGGNTIVELKVGEKEKLNVLVHAVQYDPLTDIVTHIDFMNVRMDQEIHAEIPLKYVGTSIAVKDNSGTLTTMDAVKVKCLPKDLVHEIEVSIEPLVDFHTNIFVKDLKVPSGITILNHADEVVATVIRPREEKEEVPVVAAVEGAVVEGATPAEGAVPASGAASAAPAKDKK